MTPEDLARLHARAFADDRGWSAAEFADLTAAPGAILTGDSRAFALGRVVLDDCEILTVATDPDHRRKGLAAAAVTDLLRHARAMGAVRVLLEVAADNIAAQALYTAQGFAPIGARRGYYRRAGAASVDALVLSRSLDPAPPA